MTGGPPTAAPLPQAGGTPPLAPAGATHPSSADAPAPLRHGGGSLQRRLLVLVLGSVAVVWLASALLTWRDAQHELDELLDGHLAQAAALLVAQQARELGERHDGGHDDDRRVDAPSLHRYAPQVTFQVWHEGRLALRSAHAPAAPMAPPGARFEPGLRTLTIDGTRWRVFAAVGAEADVRVYVAEQLGSRDAILRAVLRGLLQPAAAALPLLALALWWAVRRGTAPLRRLGDALRRRAPDALQPVALADAPAEMQPMLDALNALFARIDALMRSERRFTADAAHELRTPVAAIRAQAQAALLAREPDARGHALRATLDGCDRAARLIEQLLMLSRLEAGGATARAPVDLGALARRVGAELAPAALQQQQALEVDAPAQPCTVDADETLLAVLLRNLVDNGVRYAGRGARIVVRVRPAGAAGSAPQLDVDDGGPGLSDSDLARLGQRFFRALGTDAPGSGLGWSIVRRVAEVLGAAVEVQRSAALGGLAVRVRFAATQASGLPPRTEPDPRAVGPPEVADP